MRIADMQPKWLEKDGQRVGYVFRCPNCTDHEHWLTCFSALLEYHEQMACCVRVGLNDDWCSPCKQGSAWTISGDSFDTLSSSPSLNAGNEHFHKTLMNGEWH